MLISLLSALAAPCLMAQEALSADSLQVKQDTLKVDIFYRLDKSVLDTLVFDNSLSLSSFKESLEELKMAGVKSLNSVSIRSTTSPEGTISHNKDLSYRRAKSIVSLIEEEGLLDTFNPTGTGFIHIDMVGEDYGGLLKLMRADKDPYASQVEDLMDTYLESNPAKLKLELQKADEGKLWSHVNEEYFPYLRASYVELVFDHPLPQPEPEPEPIDTIVSEPEPVVEPIDTIVPEPVVEKIFIPTLNVHTNLLYDVLYLPDYGLTSAPSIGIEYYPEKEYGHWTASLDFEFPHWREKDWNHRYFQLYDWTLTARYYFNPEQYHYQGLYAQGNAQIGYYGICLDGGKGYQGELFGAGLGVGYKRYFQPESLTRRWFFDAGITVGDFYTRFDPYIYGYDETRWYYYDYYGDPRLFVKRNHGYNYFGITRVYFTIGVDLFDRSEKKGGDR